MIEIIAMIELWNGERKNKNTRVSVLWKSSRLDNQHSGNYEIVEKNCFILRCKQSVLSLNYYLYLKHDIIMFHTWNLFFFFPYRQKYHRRCIFKFLFES